MPTLIALHLVLVVGGDVGGIGVGKASNDHMARVGGGAGVNEGMLHAVPQAAAGHGGKLARHDQNEL